MQGVATVTCIEQGLNCTDQERASITSVVRRDYGELEIYFDELLHEQVTTVPAYNILALFCDIGGALGLILGSTVLTLFELFDFFIVLAHNSICLSMNKVKGKP